MIQKLTNLQRKIDFWEMYLKQHQKAYSGRHMATAWHKRMTFIADNILKWRLEEIEMIKQNPSLYKRKMKLIENLLYQMEYHQCEKERIVRKHYETEEELDFGMVEHHQREALLLAQELHFEFVKNGMRDVLSKNNHCSVVLNTAYEM